MGKHAIERTKQRYNMDLSYKDEKSIMTLIKNGRSIPLDLPTDNDNVHFAYVVYNNIPIKVLYSEWEDTGKIRSIVTAYPLDVDEYNRVTRESLDDRIRMAKEFLQANKYVVYKRRI